MRPALVDAFGILSSVRGRTRIESRQEVEVAVARTYGASLKGDEDVWSRARGARREAAKLENER